MHDSFEQSPAGVHRSEVPRPEPPRHLGELAHEWLAWFGVARLLALGVTVLLVGAGGYWLLQAPPPPVEASLPYAATTTTVTRSTAAGAEPGAGLEPDATLVPISPPTTVPSPAFVHVAGAVNAPGVYQLPPGSRVINSIEAAGGAAPNAALDGLNLAAPVADGQRVYVPLAGEVDPTTVDNGPAAHSSVPGGASATAGVVPGAPIDVNRATSVELETLPGVGPATAAAIVDDRERNGPFANVDDLDRVTGIGPATLAALRELVTV